MDAQVVSRSEYLLYASSVEEVARDADGLARQCKHRWGACELAESAAARAARLYETGRQFRELAEQATE